MSTGTSRTPTDLTCAIASEIDLRRTELGLSQQDVADFLGTSKGQVSKFLNGEKGLTVRELELICKGLGLKPSRVIRAAEARLAAQAATASSKQAERL